MQRGSPTSARWAYSELLSDRPYDDPSVQELKKKALERVPFKDLNAEEHGVLAQAWYRVRGVPTFIHGFAGITSFQLADWSREQIAASYVIPYFAHEVGAQEPITFEQWIEAEPIRSLEPGHARYATSGAPRSAQGEPLLVGRLAGLPTLSTAIIAPCGSGKGPRPLRRFWYMYRALKWPGRPAESAKTLGLPQVT